MINSYFDITMIAEWSAFIMSLILLDRKTSPWQIFKLLMFLTVFVESAGWYIHTILKSNNNTFPFNILMIVSLSFFIWLFSKADANRKIERLLQLSAVFFFIMGLINLFFFQGFWIYNSYTEALGDLTLVVILFRFLFSILKEEEYRNLFQYEYFWLATGLLFSSLGSVLIYFFLNDLLEYEKQEGISVYDYINYVINVTLYLSLIIAFICRRKTTRLSQALS